MSTAKERYKSYLSMCDGDMSAITDHVTELEQEKAELLEFVRDIAYNDISRNDITLDWVQKASWELLNKHTEAHNG